MVKSTVTRADDIVGTRSVRSVRRVEARLVARLMAGDLTAAGYRGAMARLAADDAVCHPLVAPDR
jgi:hypothetical protein